MRVLVTRPEHQTEEFTNALRSIGATPIHFPTISIDPIEDTTALDRALSCLEKYEWLILTSANAADVVLERLDALGLTRPTNGFQVSAIGPKTAARLQHSSLQPDFIPQKFVAEEIVPGLGDLRGRWVLLPVADIAHNTLPDAIQAADGIAHVITAYHTVPAIPDAEGWQALRDGIDVLTFTSGSTARNFCQILENAGLDPLNLPGKPIVACIGPKTASSAAELGFSVSIVPEDYTTDGLVQAINATRMKLNDK